MAKSSMSPPPDPSPQELLQAQKNVAMKSLDHFHQWLKASDREFLVFLSSDLINALKMPSDAQAVQNMVHLYRSYRMTIAYDVRIEDEPITGEKVEVPVVKDDRLTLAEKDRLVRKLAGDLQDAIPGWSLDSHPIG